MTPATRTNTKRRRWTWPVAALVLVALACALLWLGPDRLAERRLREAEAEVDRLDPAWRLSDLQARREPIPPGQNSADVVRAAAALLPPRWPDEVAQRLPLFNARLDRQPPQTPSEEVRADLRKALGRVRPALNAALPIADMPRGRYFPETGRFDPPNPLPQPLDMHPVATLLRYEAIRRALDGDADGGLTAVRAVLNVARSTHDDPGLTYLLHRTAINPALLDSLERVLSLTTPGAAALAGLGREFAAEETAPTLLTGLRGERALADQLVSDVLAGRVAADGNLLEHFADRRAARRRHGDYLEVLTAAAELARQPPAGWLPQVPEHQRRADRAGMVSAEAMVLSFLTTEQRRLAHLRVAGAALAVERFRLAKGDWPPALDDLVRAKLLDAVPADPYDAQPLRYVRRPDGVTVYSVGPGGTDDGGKPDPTYAYGQETDIAFRLYDVPRRGRPRDE